MCACVRTAAFVFVRVCTCMWKGDWSCQYCMLTDDWLSSCSTWCTCERGQLKVLVLHVERGLIFKLCLLYLLICWWHRLRVWVFGISCFQMMHWHQWFTEFEEGFWVHLFESGRTKMERIYGCNFIRHMRAARMISSKIELLNSKVEKFWLLESL